MTVATSHSLSVGEANQSVGLLIFRPSSSCKIYAHYVRHMLTALASFVFSNRAGSFLPQGLYICKSFCLERSLAHSPFPGFSSVDVFLTSPFLSTLSEVSLVMSQDINFDDSSVKLWRICSTHKMLFVYTILIMSKKLLDGDNYYCYLGSKLWCR